LIGDSRGGEAVVGEWWSKILVSVVAVEEEAAEGVVDQRELLSQSGTFFFTILIQKRRDFLTDFYKNKNKIKD